MMKKGLKIAGAIAGVAALVSLLPYSHTKDEGKDEVTVKALLWKYTNRPHPSLEGEREITVDLSFQNPLACEEEDLLAEDETDFFTEEPAVVTPSESCAEAPVEEPIPQPEPL